MNKIEIDREELLKMWNNSFSVVQQLQPFLQKPAEYYYHSGVVDTCRLLFGEESMVGPGGNHHV